MCLSYRTWNGAVLNYFSKCSHLSYHEMDTDLYSIISGSQVLWSSLKLKITHYEDSEIMCVTRSNDRVCKIKFSLSIIFTGKLAFSETISVFRSNDKVCKIKFPLSIIFTGRLSFLITPITTCRQCRPSNQVGKLFQGPTTTCFYTVVSPMLLLRQMFLDIKVR